MSGDLMNGRDQFAAIYRTDVEAEAAWLRYGAAAKVDSLQAVLAAAAVRPRSLLELGCGTGAVILECERRGVAQELTAIDYSEDAIRYLTSQSQGIRCVRADITAPGADLGGPYDVVVLSHVLEHLEQPLALLRALSARVPFRYLVAEVPLEDLPVARLKGVVRDRTRNAAGHVQFFTPRSFRALLAAADLTIVAERRYVPVLPAAAVDLQAARHGLSRPARAVKYATQRWLPRLLAPLWQRLYYAHHTVLLRAPERAR